MGNTNSTTTAATNAASSYFSKFESLPKELRLQIWEDAVDSIEPGFVVIRAYPKGQPFVDESSPDVQFTTEITYVISASAPVPALLQVNAEARQVALKKYRPMFADFNSTGLPLYFNPDKDRLHLIDIGPSNNYPDTHWTNKLASSPALQQDLALVKHLLAYEHGHGYNSNYNFPYRLMPFESLETIIVCKGKEEKTPRLAILFEAAMVPTFEDTWITEMNPEQVRKGKRATPPPTVFFLSWPEIKALGTLEEAPSQYLLSFPPR